jgi:drug/metabolite transporter (DMT)-like permease
VLSLFVFIWGANFVLAEVALREMVPISFSVSRFIVGGAALLGLLYTEYHVHVLQTERDVRIFPRLEKGDWPRLLLVAVLGGTLAPWLGIEGLGFTHGARASLWLALGPVMSSGFGLFWETERIGWRGYLGILLAAAGTFALAVDGLRPGSGYWLGDLLLFAALLLTVVELHLIKPLAARYGSTPVVAARTSIGGLLYLVVAAPTLVSEPWLTFGPWTWIAILLGGAIGVGSGQWVKVRALRKLGPTRVILYGNLVPLATLAIAWLAIGTIPSVLELAAGFFIVCGVFCLQVLDGPVGVGQKAPDPERTPARDARDMASDMDVESIS